jgi:hypothetical protein
MTIENLVTLLKAIQPWELGTLIESLEQFNQTWTVDLVCVGREPKAIIGVEPRLKYEGPTPGSINPGLGGAVMPTAQIQLGDPIAYS